MKTMTRLIVFCLLVIVPGLSAQTFHTLTPLNGFGPSATGEMLADGSVPFLTGGTVQRGMAHNPATGNLIFVDRGVGGQSADVSGAIYVLNGTNGSVITTLNTNGIQGGGFAHYAVGVADDGTVYVANIVLATNATITTTEQFKVYRWASETSTDAPSLAFSGILGTNNFRWGNTIDVRGSGPDTQILVSAGGAESAILTTTDGITFTSNVLTTDFAATLQGTISFGEGNTYWSKFAGQTLRLLSFDLGSKTATTIQTVDVSQMPEINSHEIAAVDNANDLLATVNYTTNPHQLSLYDISDTNDVPQLLDTLPLTTGNNGTSGSPKGYVMFGGGNIYVHSLNNGIYAFQLVGGAVPAPVILTQPASRQLLQGSSVIFRVIAQRGLDFQWRKGATNIANATNSILALPNIQFSDAGVYSVVVSNATSSVTSSNANLAVLAIEDFYRLTPLWSTAPNTQPYFSLTGGSSSGPNQRDFAYNEQSNHLYVVSRIGGTANFNVWVVDAETGASLYTLNTNGSNFSGFAGGIGLDCIEVADDGSIYAANLDVSAAGATPAVWRVYRWADGGSNTIPTMVFAADPLGSGASYRWGDAMHLRGSGINTEIIVDNREANDPNSSFVAILKPTDATLNNFTSQFFFLESTNGGNAFARTLQFGPGNTFWQKRQNRPLTRSSYDLTDGSFLAPVIETFTNFASTLAPVTIDASRNLIGAVNLTGVVGASPDQVDLYDVTDLSSPILLSRYPFPENKRANAGAFSQVVFGGDKMFALEAQNGLVAFRVEIGALPPTLEISRSGNNVVLTWEGAEFVLEAKTNLTSLSWENIPYTSGMPNTATNLISENVRFYRLRK